MRIEKKHEAELEKRKGLTKRTILAGLWLFISFAISYLAAGWLMSSDILGLDFFYEDIGIPETVSEVVMQIAVAFVIFLMIQFVVLIGYAVTSPKAKMRPGTPTTYSSEKDPYDQTINYD
ncbi:MAG: hypothetical protein WA996_03380 [Candidatus Promineifilaceae bacterium]